MTIVVTHTTPADSSFSTEGAAAWNANHALSGVGTMAEQNANSVAITGGAIDGTTVGATTPAAATFTTLRSTDQADLGGISGQESLRVISVGSATTPMRVTGTSASAGGFWSTGSISFACGTTQMSFRSAASTSSPSAGPEQMRITHTASAVNYVQVTGATTTNRPAVSAQGSDTDIGLVFVTKGSGAHSFASDNNTGTTQFRIARTASSVNYLQAAGAATNNEPVFSAQGSDTNISMAFQSKGTGGISLSTGSTGTNLVNGTSVTAITRTSSGTGYTSVPNVTISAPTTAGGVQATASLSSIGLVAIAGLGSGGTGYSVNDVLTISGGTFTTAATITVTAVSGGVITAFAATTSGAYTATPANPASVTGGTGTGATFNLTFGFANPAALSITNAGSGYVEQPTVTFSGGGGSGAAAYATVGSETTVRSLHGTMSFVTPAGTQAQVSDSGGTPNAFVNLNGSTFGLAFVTARGPIANAGLALTSKGTSAVSIYTNTTGSQAAAFIHTASAVNYVQVTGAATNANPTISAQGSDTNSSLWLLGKGGGQVVSRSWFQAAQASANYWQLAGANAGSAPAISVLGSDTNIDLALTPKGTGTVVANGPFTATGQTSLGGSTTDDVVRIYRNNTIAGTTASFTAPALSFIPPQSGFGAGILRSSTQLNITTGNTASIVLQTASTLGFAGTEQMRVSHTASAVNYVQVTGSVTSPAASTIPSLSVQGSDANTYLGIGVKGTSGYFQFFGNAASNNAVFRVNAANASTTNNILSVNAAASGSAPSISVLGSTDANVDLALTPKGTGLVRFGTYTATALSIAGYIEIKDSGGTVRRLAVVA